MGTEDYGMDGTVNTEETYNITLMNKISGATFANVMVYGTNTLEQLFLEYADDIGVDPKKETINFTNKRTQEMTPNKNVSVADFDLRDGDVLVISDDGKVA